MKMKNLLTDSPSETVYRADDKFDVIQLDRKEVSYSYFADPLYVFMDAEYNQYEIEAECMTRRAQLSRRRHALRSSLLQRQGDLDGPAEQRRSRSRVYRAGSERRHSGKVMKPARLATGFELPVPAFVEIGDKIDIDTRSNEYRSRVR
jgi:elongation factor P